MSRMNRRQFAFNIVVILLTLIALGIPFLLATSGLLESTTAAAWSTAFLTGGIAAAAWLGLWPAARQAKLAAQAEEAAAQASIESHRPYVTLGTRISIEGGLYLDLVNHGDRAALGTSVGLSHPPLYVTDPKFKSKTPFGNVSYLAPGERRSIYFAGSQDGDDLPTELVVQISYSGEDGEQHAATVVHNMDALKGVLTNPDNIKSPQSLLREGLQGIERIVTNAIRPITDRGEEPPTDPSD